MSAVADKPKYMQVADDLRERILHGELKVGDRLPSYTEMNRQYGATTATAQRVCDLLEQESLIERRSGSGIFVAAPRRRTTGNIGFIGTVAYETPTMPYYQQLMGAMQQAAREAQKHLLYLGHVDSWDPKGLEKVDGVLLCNLEYPEAIINDMPPGMPRVSLLTALDGIDSVGVDEYRAARMATQHLLEAGHTRIACLMEKQSYQSRQRYAGYRDTLLDAGIEPQESWARLSPHSHDDTYRKEDTIRSQLYLHWGRCYMSDWLKTGWLKTGCTAILVQNELAAIGAMQVLQSQGIAVPGDVSLMGFDGTPLCEIALPRLSAVVVPLAQIGAKAIQVLDRQISGEPNTGQVITLPLHLNHGDSVAAPRAAAS